MIAESLAILTSFLFAVGNVLAKKGMKNSNPQTGYLLNVVASAILFWVVFLGYSHEVSYDPVVIMIFILAGVFGTTLGRFTYYIGIDKVGASVSTAISNLTPLYTFFVAFMFLGEEITLNLFTGTLAAVVGVILLSLRDTSSSWSIGGLAFPLLAGFFFALGIIFRKVGLGYFNSPIFGGTVNTTAALAVYLVFTFVSRARRSLSYNRRSTIFFLMAGTAESTAILGMFVALSIGAVSVVAPLLGLAPLFVLPMTFLFLKGVERVTYKIIAGSGLVVFGVVLITGFSG